MRDIDTFWHPLEAYIEAEIGPAVRALAPQYLIGVPYGPDGAVAYPSFQFDRNRNLRPIVRRVNDLLGAATDQMGVLGWWLQSNAHFINSVPPWLFLDTQAERQLLRLAVAEAYPTD